MGKCRYLFLSLFIASCASDSGIITSGANEYLIAKQAATGFPGTGGIKTDALAEASNHCIDQGKSLNVIELSENEGPYVLGKYPRVELTFSCN